DLETALDIGRRLCVRTDGTQRPLGSEQGPEQLVHADDPEPFELELFDDRAEQTVVAERAQADTGEKPGRAPTGPDRAQAGPAHGTRHDELLDLILAQEPQRLGPGAQPDARMRDSREIPGIGGSFQ